MGYALIVETDKPINGSDSSFHLSMFGMRAYRSEMGQMNMIDWSQERPEFGKYEEHAESIRVGTPDVVTGILSYKLCSNDGWLVPPSEINAALESYAVAEADGQEVLVEDIKYWREFIRFLKIAAKHDGFRVW